MKLIIVFQYFLLISEKPSSDGKLADKILIKQLFPLQLLHHEQSQKGEQTKSSMRLSRNLFGGKKNRKTFVAGKKETRFPCQ